MGQPLIVFGEGKFEPDQFQKLLLGLAAVAFHDRFFSLHRAASAGKAVDRLARHLVDQGMHGGMHRRIEFVVLKKIIGRLPVSVSCVKPGRESAVAVPLQKLLRPLDPLAVKDDRLVCDRFHFGCDGGEGEKIGIDVVRIVRAVRFEDRFDGFFFFFVERGNPEYAGKA